MKVNLKLHLDYTITSALLTDYTITSALLTDYIIPASRKDIESIQICIYCAISHSVIPNYHNRPFCLIVWTRPLHSEEFINEGTEQAELTLKSWSCEPLETHVFYVLALIS